MPRTINITCGFAFLTFAFAMTGIAEDKIDSPPSKPSLTLHEWGTFTVLQNDNGEPIPGVNVNEERLPKFVYRLGETLAPNNSEFSPFRSRFAKGIASGYPAALMRMETPVIYLYPPQGQDSVENVNIQVDFHGGWISEWFPKAKVEAPGFKPHTKSLGQLAPQSTGSITWNNLTIGKEGNRPKTNEHVWLAPRRVSAPLVTSANNESENYLFYRGIANIESPVRVKRNDKQAQFTIAPNPAIAKTLQDAIVEHIWQVEILKNGSVAWKKLPSLRFDNRNATSIESSASFNSADFSQQNLQRLQHSMLEALMAEGLFRDEAIAMLETWKLSYFKTPGLRIFFTLPEKWTNAVLPLNVSHPVKTTRVMIGRIELVSNQQRTLLKDFPTGKVSDTSWFFDAYNKLPSDKKGAVNRAAYFESNERLTDFRLTIPEDYKSFLALGRFREALVLEKLRTEPTDQLRKFVNNYRLRFRDSFNTSQNPAVSQSNR